MEVEFKFLAEKRTQIEWVAHAVQDWGWKVTQTGRAIINDTYYDTPDRDLLAAGDSVRRRAEKGQLKVTVKTGKTTEDGLFRREEWEKPLAEVGQNYFAQKGLISTLHVHNTRRTFALTKGDCEVELALDLVGYRFPGRPAARDFQVELELKSETGAEEFMRLGEAVKKLPGLTPATQSKYQRGMELTSC